MEYKLTDSQQKKADLILLRRKLKEILRFEGKVLLSKELKVVPAEMKEKIHPVEAEREEDK